MSNQARMACNSPGKRRLSDVRVAVFALAAMVFALACGSESVSPLPEGGTFTLYSVNGLPLPAPLSGGGTVSSGSLLLDGTRMVEIAEVRTSPPSNGLPGLSIFSSGQWAMTAAGGGYVLTASNTATGASGDTLYISASQVVVRHPASLSDAGAERVYVR